MFSLDELDAATTIVRRHIDPTPQYPWPLLCDEVGAEVWVKHENHTRIGAFKVRGGLVFVERLRRSQPDAPGLVTATRGNHGQSIAYAAAAAGLPVTVFVPHGNNPEKNAAMAGFGAKLVEHGDDFQAAREAAADLAAREGLVSVPSFHRDLATGVATYARELFDAAGALDTVYVAIGMGSGICGLMGVRDLLGLPTEIVGVVAERAPSIKLSFDSGTIVTTERADTFIDGVACRVPDEEGMAAISAGASRVVAVSEDACADAIRVLLRTTHNVPEPAGAIATAALLAERQRQQGKRVGVILSGGNIDAGALATILAGNTPDP